MAKTSIDKSLFQGLKDTLAQTPDTPTQKIAIVEHPKISKKEEEAPFTLWIPKTLMKKIKLKALDDDSSIKEVILTAIRNKLLN